MLQKERWDEILEALNANRFRTIMTAFGVFWGIFILVILLALTNGLKNGVQADFGDFATNTIFMWTQSTSMPYQGFTKGRNFNFRQSDVALLKEKFERHKPAVSLNILRWPSFMSPLVFPDNIKDHCRDKLYLWYDKNKTNDLFSTGELAQVERLIDYIDVVDTPHRRTTEDKTKLQHDFKSFYSQYDKRRNKDISVFPKILIDWLHTIEVENTLDDIEMIEGTITHYDV